jgi:hypothetical protein
MNNKFIAIIEDAPGGGYTSKLVNTSEIDLNDSTDVLTDLDMCNYAVMQFANPDALTDCVIFNTLSEANTWINKKGVQA